jgi:hypothetical protein
VALEELGDTADHTWSVDAVKVNVCV